MNNKLAIYDRRIDLVAARLDEVAFPRLKDIRDEVAFPQIRAMVVGAAALRGAALHDDIIDITATAFYQEIREDFPNLTLPEIGRAVRDGCFEKYGPVYGLNAVSLYKMVEGYRRSSLADDIARREREQREGHRRKDEEWARQHPDYFLDKAAEQFAETHNNNS